MDLLLTPEQDQLVRTFASLYAKESSPERVRAAEGTGFDGLLWDQVIDLGVLAMAVDEEHGGWGASLLDLGLIAEQQGRTLAPVPIVETQCALRLLARIEGEAAASTRRAALEGERLVTMALHPVRDGVAGMVPAGRIADDVVALVDDRLVLIEVDGSQARIENLGSMPVADVAVGPGTIELAHGGVARAAHQASLDEWLVLTACALVGIGARALEIGVDYVKERHAWGVPIGSLQAISHPLANAATALDGARLLAYEAAWSQEADPDRFGELAPMAFAFASEAARDSSFSSLHFHGGYGFMLEYDIQMFYRRARAWARVFAGPDTGYAMAADRRYGAVRG